MKKVAKTPPKFSKEFLAKRAAFTKKYGKPKRDEKGGYKSCGNPAGRPKGSVSGRKALLNHLDEVLRDPDVVESVREAFKATLTSKNAKGKLNNQAIVDNFRLLIAPLIPKATLEEEGWDKRLGTRVSISFDDSAVPDRDAPLDFSGLELEENELALPKDFKPGRSRKRPQ